MRLAFSTLICPGWPLETIIRGARENGMQGIDFRGVENQIDITRLDAFKDGLPGTLKRLRADGLELPCFNMSVLLVSPAADRWEMMLDECRRYAELSEKTHTPYLRVFGGCLPKGMNRVEAMSLARRHLRQAVKVCAPFGCRVLLETHDDWSASEHILELLDPFDPAEVGVLWDVEHPFRAGEAPAKTAGALKRWITHAHIKDSILEGTKRTPTRLGEGQLPLEDFLAALRSIGYGGWMSLETEKRWNDAAPEPEESLPQYARFMKGR